jgi:hypothetical protein
MAKKIYLLISLAMVSAVLLSACGTPAAPSGSSGGSDVNDPGLSAREEAAFPQDLPLPEGAYKVDVSAGGTQVSYEHTGTIQDMVDYLQSELPGFGWDVQTSPDSAVGSIATMLRKNAAGDTLSVNMQYNSNGDFTTLTMAVLRANK